MANRCRESAGCYSRGCREAPCRRAHADAERDRQRRKREANPPDPTGFSVIYYTKPCANCGAIKVKRDRDEARRRKFCSKACFFVGRDLKATFRPGADHPSWAGGLSCNDYPSEFKPSLKRRIRERDGYVCVLCGITEEDHKHRTGRVLSVNHIDFNKQNCSEENLNTLCIACNTRINFDREKWTAFFQAQMAVI